MKRIFALVLALAMVLSVSAFAGDTFNPNVAISEDKNLAFEPVIYISTSLLINRLLASRILILL